MRCTAIVLPAALSLLAAVSLVDPRRALAQLPPTDPAAPPPAAPGQFQPPPQPPAPSPFGGMNAGGLTPPPPTEAAAPPGAPGPPGVLPPADGELTTDEELDRAVEEDSGRGLTWVWAEVGGGFEHVGLQTFNVDEQAFSAGFIETSASGAVIDGGLGVRLLFLTLGARARMGFFSPWQLGRIGGEVGLRIPIGRVEPRFDAGFGYAALTGVSATTGNAIDTNINGFYGRLGAGIDVFPVNWLSVGGGVSWELLGLTRPGLSVSDIAGLEDTAEDDPEAAGAVALSAEGSGYGSSLAITARVGVHF